MSSESIAKDLPKKKPILKKTGTVFLMNQFRKAVHSVKDTELGDNGAEQS